jgi:hypothetical protein
MAANERFTELVIEGDLGSDVKNTFAEQLQLQKMEEQIEAKEQPADQAAKSLFIRTMTMIKNSSGVIAAHVEYLPNIITLTDQTKEYVLNTLNGLMQTISRNKVRVDNNFSMKAAEYKRKLSEARFQQSMAKAAA